MIFVGYESGTKGYQFCDHHTWSIIVSRKVTFDRISFSRQNTSSNNSTSIEGNLSVTSEPTPDNTLSIVPEDFLSGDQPPAAAAAET